MSSLRKLLAVGSSVAMMVVAMVPSVAFATHGPGSVVSTSDGTVWFITNDNQRRAFTSAGAFLSYGFLSFSQVVPADAGDLALTAGPFIAPRDGSIFCATATKGSDVAGECALITGGMKARFTSAAVFTAQGHRWEVAESGDSSFLTNTANIDNGAAQHRPGVLINNNGTIQLVGTSSLLGIPSLQIFNDWGYSLADVVPANAEDVKLVQSGVMCARQPGQLNPSFTAGSCGVIVNPPPSGGGLQGGAGSIEDVDELSSLQGEEVGEGDENTQVAGFNVQADNGSDLEIMSVRITLEQTTGADSQDIDDYLDNVSVWMGDDEVGSADADEFSENSDIWSKTISLSNAIVRADQDQDFFIAVDALGTIDSNDLDTNSFTLVIEELRFRDATGAILTDDTTGDLPITVNFSFETLASAQDIELEASLTDSDEADDINDAHVVEIPDNDDLDDVELLAFDLEATGDIMNIEDIPVVIGQAAGSTGDVDEMASSFSLWMGDDEIDTVAVADGTADNFSGNVTEVAACASTGCTIHFDDIDFDLDDGETASFMVKADINEVDGVTVAEGDGLFAELSATAVDNIEAEDEGGDELGATELTGTAIGEVVTFYTIAFNFDLVSATAVAVAPVDATADGTGTFTIKFELTAFGDDVTIDRSCVEDQVNAADQGVEYTISNGGLNTTNCSLTSTADDNPNDVGAAWIVREGETEEFTLSVATATITQDQFTKVWLTSINWDNDVTDTSPDLFFTAGLGEQNTSTNEVFIDNN